MAHDSGPLVPADETLTHQIVDTFATVSHSDPSWTEKIWASAHARDGSLQAVFGVGKYTNRGVFDGAGGVSRGSEQWTVRASRRLSTDPAGTSVGPLHYEVLEPLVAVRCVLEPTQHADISFDITWRGLLPAELEESWPDRSPDGYRLNHDVLRYHQVGTADGWIEVEGLRTEVNPAIWFTVRDHSWGVRPGIGLPIAGVAQAPRRDQTLLTWFPMLLERADGTRYSLFVYYEYKHGQGFESTRSQGRQQNDDGTTLTFASVSQHLAFDDDNRRFLGGTIALHESSGAIRTLTITPVSKTGFHLGTAGYFGWKGRLLGQWAGDLAVDGEHIINADAPATAHQLHQLRDLLVKVEDPAGGGAGVGNIETLAVGEFPDLGLSSEKSFL
jgi:hypothetical protein